ncbi:MAG TPA: glutamate--cysteine ligase [Casimicrobiaceae bacterium]|nr:glutamate--cysteine ligase [Casimicrobiaceae bacterium]
MSSPQSRLDRLSGALGALRRGVEKESLRVTPDGNLAATPHPEGLGSALTHPHVTTDFSEAQLELITGVNTSADACAQELTELHRFVYAQLRNETMWCCSMPCKLPDDASIPLAQYGSSNIGRAKTIYRTGLSHRYGRRMQLISGVHYNFSMPEEVWPLDGLTDVNSGYFALIRNFRRNAWLLLYLFGASPAVCECFVAGRNHGLQQLAPGTMYLPYATSLRMGRLGYLSEAQEALWVSYNDLDSYGASLARALTQSYPTYEKIGLRDGDGYRQLATTLLQIENEFYSTIRPKRVIRPGERPLHALRERGVQYVEVRAMDLDPFCAIGVSADTMRFLDIFLVHCLITPSPPDTLEEIQAIGRNKQRVAARGREPGLQLERGSTTVALGQWAAQVLDECKPIAAALAGAYADARYPRALEAAIAALADPDSLPSARVLRDMKERYDGSYFRFSLDWSMRHRDAIRAQPLSGDMRARFDQMAQRSRDEQRAIEAADNVPFETFRRNYLAPESLLVR